MGRLEGVADNLIKNTEDSDYYNPNSILNIQSQKNRFKIELLSTLGMENSTDRMKRAIELINSANIFSLEERNRIKLNINKMAADLSELEENHLLQDCYGISDNDMELWYRAALDLYKQHCYQEAGDLFTLLIMLNPSVESYLLGLGGAEHMAKHYQAAIDVYEQAIQIKPTNGLSYLLVVQCLLLLNNKRQAQERWENAKQIIADNGSQPHWNELIALLEKKMN
jgi:tetratricopeptide (TPR) repeat protein